MLCVPGRCIKCPAKIVSGTNVGDKYEEIDFLTSEGSIVTVGVCRDCTIEPSDIPEIEMALLESFAQRGPTIKIKLKEILRRKGIIDILKEVQSSRCVNCDEKLGPEWVLSNGRAIHAICEHQKSKPNETPHEKELELRTAKKVIQNGRRSAADYVPQERKIA